MQSTLKTSEVAAYLKSNPGKPVYLVHNNNILIRLVYYKEPFFELTNFLSDPEAAISKHPLDKLNSQAFWTDGDVVYTLMGMKELLDREGILD